MKINIIDAGNFKCDGGAVFGVVPKVLWEKHYPADSSNYCNLAMRCLLVENGDRRILIDTGAGNKQSSKFFSHYHLNGNASLTGSLKKSGYDPSDITDVVLTHLHFDHCGGAVNFDEKGLSLAFPNAIYWISLAQWNNFFNPNPRESAVYFHENISRITDAGKIRLIGSQQNIIPELELRVYNGHSPGQIIPFIYTKKGTIVFMADLIPVMASIPILWVSAYDVQPLVSLNEKKSFLTEAVKNDYTLFFEHDLYNECCKLTNTAKGITFTESFPLKDFTV